MFEKFFFARNSHKPIDESLNSQCNLYNWVTSLSNFLLLTDMNGMNLTQDNL